MKKQDILILPIARETKVVLVFTGEITQEAISKLIELLECEKDTYPTVAEKSENAVG